MAMADPIDPALWDDPDMRVALARRDIGEVYRRLAAAGITQRRIAELTGQRQSEVSAIVHGRPVQSIDVLIRIADGLGVPRGWMGLDHDEISVQYTPGYDGPITVEDEDVKRRLLLSAATMAVVGTPLYGAIAPIASAPVSTPLPSRVGLSDVAALRRLTEEYRTLGRAGYGVPEVITAVTQRADQLLDLPATDVARQKLLAQMADLHTLAGWWHTDMLQNDWARWHYSRAIKLAADAEDVLGMVSAVRHAAAIDLEGGAPDDALKLYQLAQTRLLGLRSDDPGLAAQLTMLHVRSAYALALLDKPDKANRELARAAESPPLDDPFEHADADYLRAKIELAFGRYTRAQQHAFRSVRTWGLDDRRDSAKARITLATANVIVGDSDAPKLVIAALDAVGELRSTRSRTLLAPLGKALEARGDSTSVELAQRVRVLRQGSTTID